MTETRAHPRSARERLRVTKVERDRATLHGRFVPVEVSPSFFQRSCSLYRRLHLVLHPRSKIHSAGCCCMNENRRPRKPARVGAGGEREKLARESGKKEEKEGNGGKTRRTPFSIYFQSSRFPLAWRGISHFFGPRKRPKGAADDMHRVGRLLPPFEIAGSFNVTRKLPGPNVNTIGAGRTFFFR